MTLQKELLLFLATLLPLQAIALQSTQYALDLITSKDLQPLVEEINQVNGITSWLNSIECIKNNRIADIQQLIVTLEYKIKQEKTTLDSLQSQLNSKVSPNNINIVKNLCAITSIALSLYNIYNIDVVHKEILEHYKTRDSALKSAYSGCIFTLLTQFLFYTFRSAVQQYHKEEKLALQTQLSLNILLTLYQELKVIVETRT